MSTKLKSQILDKHNYLRNNIASGKKKPFPAAVKMNGFEWDESLAYLAERNVKKCVMDHDSCFSTSKFKSPGQNLYSASDFNTYPNITKSIDTAIMLWYNESKLLNANEATSLDFSS